MTAISYHDTVNDLQGLDWADAGPFSRLQWFALLENGETAPVIALARNGASAVALPLRRAEGQLEMLTNWYAFTCQPLHTGDAPDAALMQALAADLATRAGRVSFHKLPGEDGVHSNIMNAFHNAGWYVDAHPSDTNHILPVAGRSYAQFLADRPGRLRTTLKRKAKKVQTTLATRFDASDWAAYEDIYANSWKPEEGDPAMLRSFAESESRAGRFRFAIAHHHEEPVAAQFWTVDGSTAFIHKLAHRRDADRLSPGTTLTAALFEHVIDTDCVELVDFGTGDDPYKRDWMEDVRMRWQVTCLRREKPRNWSVIAKARLRKLVSARNDG